MKVKKLLFKKYKQGITLVEMVVVLSIIIVLSGIIYQFVVQGNKMFIQSRDQALAQDVLRKVTDSIAKELREAQNADNGAYLLENVSDNTIIFYSDIDNDGSKEKLRYFLEGINFKKGMIKPTGTPAQYLPSHESITNIVSNIYNTTPIFSYYDENYTGSQQSITNPQSHIADVRIVHMKFTADINPNQPPDAINIETSVMIRNLKANL